MTFEASAKGQLKGFLHQPNITLCSGLTFVIVIIFLLFHYLYPAEKIFVLVSVVLLVIIVLGYLGLYHWRSDSTESISVAPDGTITVKSPSKKLIPALIERLTVNTSRPNKLIPQDIDPKEDPSKFKLLTAAEREEIVRKEVADAVTKNPLIKSSLAPADT